MENFQNDLKENIEKRKDRFNSRSGRMMAGVIVVVVGTLLLARQLGTDLPPWIFTWKMLIIGIGIFIGAKHSFRGIGWLIPIVIGSAFLVEDFVPGISFHEYIWPMIIIGLGLFMIFRPRHNRRNRWNPEVINSPDDTIDSTSIFGGTKKVVITKNFKGGDITTMFGATDVDFMQADLNGTVTLDVTQMFGGTKLIIPPFWSIKSDVVCIFGSIEDKRSQMKEVPDGTKVLRLDGTCIFGGIEIKNY